MKRLTRKIFGFLKQIPKIIIGIIVLLLILELFSRFIQKSPNFIQREYEPEEFRKPYPYVMFKGNLAKKGYNENGYKGISPTKVKPSNEYRIFILGGSTVHSGSPTIPELLMSEFNQNGYTNVNVYNYGVVSAVSSQELVILVHEISNYQPDLIIQYDGANDKYHPFNFDPRPGYPYNFLAYENNPLLDPSKFTFFQDVLFSSSLLRFLGERFFYWDYINIFLPLSSLRESSNWLSEEWNNKIADIYVSNVMKSNIIARAFNSDYMIFYQPMIYNKNTLMNKEEEIMNKLSNLESYLYIDNMIVDLLSKENINFIDMRNIFNSDKLQAFTDPIHLGTYGNQIVSHVMYEKIINSIKINFP